MTQEQFDRWKDFSLRMSVVAIGGARWQRELRRHLEECFAMFDCDNFGCPFETIKDWYRSGPYPDGRRESRKSYCICNGERFMNQSRPLESCKECHGTGLHYDFVTGGLVCDRVSEYLWDERLEREKEDRHGNTEIVETKLGTAISCCLRAGLDVAVSPSAGVCGFTAGDIRKMYPEGVPDWVRSFFQEGELVSLYETNIDGIFRQETHGRDDRTFEQLPDEQAVWL